MNRSARSAPETEAPLLLADLLQVRFLLRGDLAGVFERFDALGGEFLAVVLHAKRQKLASKSVLIAILPIIISAVLAFLVGDRTGEGSR